MTTEDQFEKWQEQYDPCPTPEAYQNAKAAFLAGVQAERERCAKLAREIETDHWSKVGDPRLKQPHCAIAAAIEKGE